jgi:hypothetical protein
MTTQFPTWFMLTPLGALQVFAQAAPSESDKALQALLGADTAMDMATWLATPGATPERMTQALERGWVQPLQQAMRGPDARLDDFVQHVVAALSGSRKAALASDSGFCLGRSGLDADEADVLCAAAADYLEFAKRQTRRGWDLSRHYATFHQEAHLLLPSHTFVPFWVDGTAYVLVILEEPLLNNPALVELVWGIKLAGRRFGDSAV